MLSFRRVCFDNGVTVFLRPEDHDAQIGHLTADIMKKRLVIENMSVEEAAAWNMACFLFHLPNPTPGYAH